MAGPGEDGLGMTRQARQGLAGLGRARPGVAGTGLKNNNRRVR
jgi:hypothetical protein